MDIALNRVKATIACCSSTKQRSPVPWHRPRRLAILCTAQPRQHVSTQTREHAAELSGSSNDDTSSHNISTVVVDVPGDSMAEAVAAAGSFTNLEGAQLVVVSAASSSSAVLTSLGDASSPVQYAAAMPEGLPSPQAIDAGLTTGLTNR